MPSHGKRPPTRSIWIQPMAFPLAVNLDALFDEGLISFTDDGAILISPQLSEQSMRILAVTPQTLPPSAIGCPPSPVSHISLGVRVPARIRIII